MPSIAALTTVHLGTVVELRAVLGTHPTTLAYGARAGATALTVHNPANYTNGDTVVLNAGGDTEERLACSGVSGNVLTVAATTFAHPAGEAVERGGSGTVTITVKAPDGTSSTPSVTAAAPVYTATYATTMAGRHTWQAATGGGSAAVAERSFEVLTGEV